MAALTGITNASGVDLINLFKVGTTAGNVGITTNNDIHTGEDLAALFAPRAGSAAIANVGWVTSEGIYSNQDLSDIFMDINHIVLPAILWSGLGTMNFDTTGTGIAVSNVTLTAESTGNPE